ncbi:MAG: ABC transporter permease [Clostridiales bacterium]|nr:ABC transporter permease [Clostridiales bacterium]
MPVFKAYFRVFLKVLPSLFIYVGIFIAISVIATTVSQDTFSGDFEQTDVNIAVIDREGGSPLVEGMKAYLGKTNTFVEIEDDPEALQDALFFRKVEYILIVPEGYTDSFLSGGTMKLDKLTVPDSMNAAYLDLAVDRYWNTARLFLAGGQTAPDAIAAGVAGSLEVHTDVTMTGVQTQAPESNGMVLYYNYMAYILLAVIVLSISTILMAFNHSDIRRRNQCAPVPLRSVNAQLVLGNALVALMIWGLLVVCSLVVVGGRSENGGQITLFILNSLVFTVVCVSIGFLSGMFIRNTNVQSAVANVISLGMSFLCGVFVPQSVLSPAVLTAASFLPPYWFVKANNAIGRLTEVTADSLSPVVTAMLIQLGFAAAIFAVGLLISRQRRVAES